MLPSNSILSSPSRRCLQERAERDLQSVLQVEKAVWHTSHLFLWWTLHCGCFCVIWCLPIYCACILYKYAHWGRMTNRTKIWLVQVLLPAYLPHSKPDWDWLFWIEGKHNCPGGWMRISIWRQNGNKHNCHTYNLEFMWAWIPEFSVISHKFKMVS